MNVRAYLAFLRSSSSIVFGPIVLQQPGQRTIGEETPFGLTARAVVRLVLAPDDSLNGSAAIRTWLSEPAVDAHALVKRRHFFWKRVARLSLQALRPFRERRRHGAMQPPDLGLVQLSCQPERRQSGAMQDFV